MSLPAPQADNRTAALQHSRGVIPTFDTKVASFFITGFPYLNGECASFERGKLPKFNVFGKNFLWSIGFVMKISSSQD
jgi:hypothetical protein